MTAKISLFAAALLLFASATWGKGLQLVPGEPLRSSATVHEVQGRQGFLIRQRLRFGPYATTYVRRSAIRSWSGVTGVPGIFAAEHMQGRQSIRFSLTDGQDTAAAETVTNVRSTDLIIGERMNSLPNIVLDILATGTARQENNFSAFFATRDASWELFLDNTAAQLRRSEPAGFLRGEAGYYTIVPVWEVSRKGKVAAMPFGAAGLEFRDEEGRTCAAVSLIDRGEVILPLIAGRDSLVLAAACSALLLQSVID